MSAQGDGMPVNERDVRELLRARGIRLHDSVITDLATRTEVERLWQERQAVLDCINLYGDETLHKALDAIGWPPNGS